MRKGSFRLVAMASGLLSLVVMVSASAQGIFDYTQEIESRFAKVETHRMRGECGLRDQRLASLRNFLDAFLAPGSRGLTEAGKEEYRTRLAEAAARPCPPQVGRPAPATAPAPVAPAPAPAVAAATVAAPLPRTVTLEDLRLELAEACGARFDPARERFIAALDRAIRFETHARLRRYLEIDRAAVQRLKVPPCPSGQTTTARAGTERFFRMQRFHNSANIFSAQMQTAESARWAGDCERRARALDAAWAALLAMQQSGYTPPTRRYDEEVAREQEGRPCPDPLNRTAVRPTPDPVAPARQVPPPRNPVMSPSGTNRPAPMSVPSGSSASLSAPALPVRNCSAIDRAREPQALTCRCLGREQYLSIWGSNPYRSGSAICNAAIHAGVLPASGMGMVRVVPTGRGAAALGTTRNGIASGNWDFGFDNAFTVAAGGADPDDALPADPRWMSETFDTELGPMVLTNGRGTYGRSNAGTITPTRIAGPVLEAIWDHPSLPMGACADGRYRGRVRFVFTGAGFTGLWASCENALNSTWNGTRRKAR